MVTGGGTSMIAGWRRGRGMASRGAAAAGTMREVAGHVRVRRKLPASPRLSGELGGARGELGRFR